MTGRARSARYDRAYFDRWYRQEGFGSPARLARKVRYAVGITEYLTERPVRRVLDVGCGEGSWCPALRRLRPGIRYVGVDPSTYAVERFGHRRNLRLGDLAGLGSLGLHGPFDLIVCTDVIGYVADDEVAGGLAAIAGMLRGAALIEVFTTADAVVGDVDGYRLRAPEQYARWFAAAGLWRVGPHLYVPDDRRADLAAFERGC